MEPSELLFVSEVAPYQRPGGAATAAGVHHGLPSAAVGVAELAGLLGLGFRHPRSVRDLSDEDLGRARLLVLSTIGETPWSTAQRVEIERRAATGSLGIVALHSATDASSEWEAYGRLLGGRFDGHPVTAELPVAVVDADHPATAHLPAVWPFRDELYLFREVQQDNRILLALRMGPHRAYAAGERPTARDLPLAWCRQVGPARSFYTALGHFSAAWEDVSYLRHIQGGMAWVLGNTLEAGGP